MTPLSPFPLSPRIRNVPRPAVPAYPVRSAFSMTPLFRGAMADMLRQGLGVFAHDGWKVTGDNRCGATNRGGERPPVPRRVAPPFYIRIDPGGRRAESGIVADPALSDRVGRRKEGLFCPA